MRVLFFAPMEESKQTTSKPALPWVDKYRPKTLDEVAHQHDAISALRKSLATGDVNMFMSWDNVPGFSSCLTLQFGVLALIRSFPICSCADLRARARRRRSWQSRANSMGNTAYDDSLI